MKKFFIILGIITILFISVWMILSVYPIPQNISYGVSFSKYHSDELNLSWKETYLAILNDLGVRRFRFSAHWPNTEPQEDRMNFSELDFQMQKAEETESEVILAVGKRLPGWPECHIPSWVEKKGHDEQKEELFEYIELVVNRYKDSPALKYWQVENEPFLEVFATEHCGELNEDLLEEEIDFVKKLDPDTPVMVTDSGELSTWLGAYSSGDIFGTSVYLYIWNNHVGPIRYPIPASFFRVKRRIVEIIEEPKESILIELSAEPWLLQPIVDTPVEIQIERMGIDKFNKMIDFAKRTSFKEQYLWGAEWWYYMKENKNHPEFWMRAKEIFGY